MEDFEFDRSVRATMSDVARKIDFDDGSDDHISDEDKVCGVEGLRPLPESPEKLKENVMPPVLTRSSSRERLSSRVSMRMRATHSPKPSTSASSTTPTKVRPVIGCNHVHVGVDSISHHRL